MIHQVGQACLIRTIAVASVIAELDEPAWSELAQPQLDPFLIDTALIRGCDAEVPLQTIEQVADLERGRAAEREHDHHRLFGIEVVGDEALEFGFGDGHRRSGNAAAWRNVPPGAAPAPPPPGLRYAHPAMSRCALIVEDDHLFAEIFSRLLRQYDCEPLIVASAADAIYALQQRDYDAVILDIRLAGSDGGMVVDYVKRSKPHMLARMLAATSHPVVAHALAPEIAIIDKGNMSLLASKLANLLGNQSS